MSRPAQRPHHVVGSRPHVVSVAGSEPSSCDWLVSVVIGSSNVLEPILGIFLAFVDGSSAFDLSNLISDFLDEERDSPELISVSASFEADVFFVGFAVN